MSRGSHETKKKTTRQEERRLNATAEELKDRRLLLEHEERGIDPNLMPTRHTWQPEKVSPW